MLKLKIAVIRNKNYTNVSNTESQETVERISDHKDETIYFINLK